MKFNAQANRDDYCEFCGYPFDAHESCIDISGDGWGPIVCSEKCHENLVELEYKRATNQWMHNPAN